MQFKNASHTHPNRSPNTQHTPQSTRGDVWSIVMHSTDDFEYRASNIPTDVDLLEPLGLVMWAAIRLHHGIRDAIGSLTGIPSDEYFDETLGGANNILKREAGKLSEGQLRTDLTPGAPTSQNPPSKLATA